MLNKYKPKTLENIIGNRKQINEIKEWLKNWKKGRALILYGPTGIGKSLVIELLAREKGLELIELSSDELRSLKGIRDSILKSSKQRSLFFTEKIILFDELDSLLDNQSVRGINELIEQSIYPVILVCNDPYLPRLKPVRNRSKLVKFNKIRSNSIAKFLQRICEEENIKYEKNSLTQLARMCDGDIRSALIDLILYGADKEAIKKVCTIGGREREGDLFNALRVIFKTMDLRNIPLTLVNLSEDELFWWLEENVPHEYESSEEIAKAYDYLARADVFRSRVIKKQAWSLQKYFFKLAIFGVALSKNESYRKFVPYQPPSMFKRYGKKKKWKIEFDPILSKLSRMCHCSKQDALAYLSILKAMIKKYKRIEGLNKNELKAIRNL